MLNEMEQHAHSVKYLSKELSDNDDDIEHEQQTVGTVENLIAYLLRMMVLLIQIIL